VNIERSIVRFEMNLMSELNNQPLNSNILEYGSCLIPLKLRQYLTAIKWF